MADITVNQLATQTFYQIPQIFMTSVKKEYDSTGKVKEKIKLTSRYARELSNDAKLAYGALYNRCLLSIASYNKGNTDYVDEDGSVFLVYSVEDLMDLLDRGKTTVIKIKKELIALGLLREVSQGANRTNRLYLQNVEANFQEKEIYQAIYETKHTGQGNRKQSHISYEHVRTLNHLNEVIYEVPSEVSLFGGSESEPPTNPMKSMKSGGSNFGRPFSEPQEVQNLNPINNENNKTYTYDTDRYENESSLSQLPDSESFKMGQHGFLSPKSIELLSLFGKNAKSLENKIYQAKKQVEIEYAHLLKDSASTILGEVWSNDLEREIEKLIFKVKTGEHEGNPIQNLTGYFYKMMIHFWKLALLIEKEQGFVSLVNQSEYVKRFPEESPTLTGYYYPEKLSESQLSMYLTTLGRRDWDETSVGK